MITLFFTLLSLLGQSGDFTQAKPVTGTFLNFFWQDERNNYTNQRDVDLTDPAYWDTKIREMHEAGMDYLVFLAVANEGRAFYPSKFMKKAWDPSRPSPIDVIMNVADELGMHVIVSTGWARNQLDDLADRYVIKTQRRIMEELAALYGQRPSFYGWYLPVEGSFIPYLPDHAVEGVNSIAQRARELTPGARIMISPYGMFAADFDHRKFAEQIGRLDVDIIAHQDEVGCVREKFPMHNVKEHLRLMGEIHRRYGIEFWVNVESFTWDRRPNNWYSALIPAAFGRYLSQIVAADAAGADRIISFAVCGIMDKPGSEHPIGQPVLSNRFYEDYMAWRSGDRRWTLLEKLLRENVAEEDPDDPRWFKSGDSMESVLDLGSVQKIESVAGHFLNYRKEKITIPQSFEVFVSDDGKEFRHVRTVAYRGWPNDLLDCWSDVIIAEGIDTEARYVKVLATASKGKIYFSRIMVNP